MMTQYILEARQAKKMTQKQAAKLLNVSRQKYNKMEKGKCTIEEFTKICELFSLSIIVLPSHYIK